MVMREQTGVHPGRALLLAAQRGDLAAQAQLFETHKDAVARLILRLTGDAAAIDDLVQEVFVSAFAALPGFRGDAHIETWLHTIAVNKTRNWWTSQRRRRRREVRSSTPTSEVAEAVDEDFERAAHLRRLYRALGGLPDRLREAFTLRVIDGCSLVEVSDVLGIPISTVSYRTRRATRLLCEALGIPWQEEAS